jgi:nitroimidazol reductase NimA-like FMN-containing flavoprotein (pyridoxamine 5'-phosphate oxidase superfamily)
MSPLKEVKMIATVSLEQYLNEIRIPLRLSCVSESSWPVVLSLWYLMEDGDLYCATPQRAKVVAYLTKKPRCSFEVASDIPPYCGVRGRAYATIEPERGVEILERLLERYLGGKDNALARQLLSRPQPEVAIRLAPLSYHTWNFTDRMVDSIQDGSQKPCPD